MLISRICSDVYNKYTDKKAKGNNATTALDCVGLHIGTTNKELLIIF